MTEVNESIEPNESDVEEVYVPADEITLLKERATLMGIKFHPSVGVATLAAKIEAALMNVPEVKEDAVVAPVASPVIVPETESEMAQRLRKDATRLIRVNITCMNPNKKDWPGEIISVSNSIIGSVKKFIPFNATEGYHVPNIILHHLKERQCQVWSSVTHPNGRVTQKGKMIKEFAIEVLPNLTQDEIAELARKQAITNSID